MNISQTRSRAQQVTTVRVREEARALSMSVVGEPVGPVDLFAHIVERMRLEEALHAGEERIRELTEDRERIKCDLHDGVLPSLHAIALELESCRRFFRAATREAAELLTRSRAQLDQALCELRAFLKNDLRSGADGEEDFGCTIRTLVDTVAGTSLVRCRLTIDPAAVMFIEKARRKDVLYLVREALSNSLRHARATTVDIAIVAHESVCRIEVTDDGIGFDPDRPPRHGLGLRSLSARAAALGGRLTIASQPSRGTTIQLVLTGR